MSTNVSVDTRTNHQLLLIARASVVHQQSRGFAQYQSSKSFGSKAAKPKPVSSKMPPKRKQGVELNKQIVGSVGGVLRHHFDGCIEVQLNADDAVTNWQAADHSVRVDAMVEKFSPLVVELIDNQDGKIADPTKLLEKVKTALRVELLDADSGMLRVESCSWVPGMYRIKAKSVKKMRSGDGRPAKRIERMKTAIELRKRAA